MSKTTVRKIATFILFSIVIYALFSFVMWDFNMSNWSGFSRFMFGLMELGMAMIAFD